MDATGEVTIKTVEHSIPLNILDDLCSRFIINVPDEARENLIRICFQIELAHWFYLDFDCNQNPKLKTCGIREFAAHVFQHVSFLQPHASNLDKILEDWREYKRSVPTYGAILLSEDMTHVLLVQSYLSKNSWGFPKGKVNQDEDPARCAVREVLEETGFDIGNLIDREDFIESVINDQLVRLYIITGVPRDAKFEPQTRFEIKKIDWFPVADLPSTRKDTTPKVKMGVSAKGFFNMLPFVRRLKRWVQEHSKETSVGRRRHKSSGDSDSSIKSKNGKGKSEQDISYVENKQKKPRFKRQLFNGKASSIDSVEFTAPSWQNFKFDREAILKCLPP